MDRNELDEIDVLIEELKNYGKWCGQECMVTLAKELRHTLRCKELTPDQERKISLYGMKFILEGLM